MKRDDHLAEYLAGLWECHVDYYRTMASLTKGRRERAMFIRNALKWRQRARELRAMMDDARMDSTS